MARLRVVIRNADGVAQSLYTMNEDFVDGVRQIVQEHARKLKMRLQIETKAAYYKAATGRFSRGLNTQVTIEKSGQGATATIRVSAIEYRENKFLSELFGGLPPPNRPYLIFARGLDNPFDLIQDPIGAKSRRRLARRLAGQAGSHRLKVPVNQYSTIVHPNQRESRVANPTSGTSFLKGSEPNTSQDFYYPLWVTHPGFERDVVLDVDTDEATSWMNEQLELARFTFDPKNAAGGIGVSFIQPTIQKTVTGVRAGSLRSAAPSDPLGAVRKFVRGD